MSLSSCAGEAQPRRAPKHLWRQPRTHIRIERRVLSDTDTPLSASVERSDRRGLGRTRMSWPTSLHGLRRSVWTFQSIRFI
uniref:Uncharacterized protein n=1 Tax=Eptatretus burgeri TaxID=7764 RepID=A0A8C4X028_EPTBU